MLLYNLDIDERSTWLRTTPGEHELAQPFFCTEQGEFFARSGFFTERSDKDSYELFYTFDGCGVLEQGGKRTVLHRGSALLIDCRTPQRYRTAQSSSRWHHLWAHVDGPGVDEFAKMLDVSALKPTYLAEPIVRKHMAAIAANLELPGMLPTTVIGLSIHSLLAEMVGSAQTTEESAAGDEAVRRACALIESAYTEKISLDDIAAGANVSKSYLLKLFRKHMGTTPYEYLLRYRITRAKELLAETTDKVGSIALAVGFNSESNFSYRFSKMTGQSPRAYRESCPKPVVQ